MVAMWWQYEKADHESGDYCDLWYKIRVREIQCVESRLANFWVSAL